MKQLRAVLTISRYSLIAMLRSPTSIVFSLLFPVIFITVFGAMVGDKIPVMKIAVAPGCDTANAVYKAIAKAAPLALQPPSAAAKQADDIHKGRIAAIVDISSDSAGAHMPHYTLKLTESKSLSSPGMLETILENVVNKVNARFYPGNGTVASISVSKAPGRVYRTIDFILPGQLGFSLLMAAVYGSSFLLFSMRQNLVLKRLRVTPVSRGAIIGGEMLSRLLFHVLSFVLMVGLGYFAFQFTLVNGLATLLEMLFFSLLGLGIFMGIGFIISGLVQSENSISPIANTVVLPQILLCGLFFPVENYPQWLQHVCNLLPLTFFVDGLRKIAFEGAHIWQLSWQLWGLFIWLLIITPLSVRLFRWE